jgi:hypothetical protein
MNLKITATKCLSLMMVAGLLTITSCVENKKHNEDQDEKQNKGRTSRKGGSIGRRQRERN